MINHSTFSDKMPLLYSHTYDNRSSNSHENFLDTDNTGSHYLSFGTVINGVCKLRAAHLFPIGTTVIEMHTPNSKPRASRKTVNSDLHDILHPLYDLASSGSYSQLFFKLLKHARDMQDIDYDNAVSMVTEVSIALEGLEQYHNPSTQIRKVS